MISLNEWQQTGDYIDYKGKPIFRRRQPKPGAPVLLLPHGFPTASWDWEAVWPELAERFELLTFDFIGFGLSAKPWPHRYSILEQADIAEHILRLQGIREYHMLAHDYGDTVAQELLARQRESVSRPRLKSLCFLNGGLFPETHRALLIQKLLLSPLGPLVARLTSQSRFCDALNRAVSHPFTAEQLDGYWQLMQHNHGVTVLPGLINYMAERRRHRERWVSAIVKCSVPVAVIDGAEDPISGAHMVARYRELIPMPDTVLLKGVGHYPQVEAPAQVLSAYWDFLRRRELLSD